VRGQLAGVSQLLLGPDRRRNHRFTVDLTAHVRMKDRRGDILEGIVMCAP
jgi:hypothetical protein